MAFYKTYNLDGYKIVEAPLLEKYKKILYKTREEKQFLFANKIITTQNKFLIWSKGDTYVEVIMTIVGDKKYLLKHKDLSDIAPNNIASDFSGMIYYKRFNGKFLKGWFFDEGKMTNKIKWYKTSNVEGEQIPTPNSTANTPGNPCLQCTAVTTYNTTENGCVATTIYINNITDNQIPGINHQENVEPSNCEGNSDGNGDDGDDDNGDDGNGDGGGFGDDGSDGQNICFMYPNPFCACANGVYFDCNFEGEGSGGGGYIGEGDDIEPFDCEAAITHPLIDTIHTNNERIKEAFKYILPPSYCSYVTFNAAGNLDKQNLLSAQQDSTLPQSDLYDALVACVNSNFNVDLYVSSSWEGMIGMDSVKKNYSWESTDQTIYGITVVPGNIPNIGGVPATGIPSTGWVFIRRGEETSNQRLAFIIVHELLGHMYSFMKNNTYIHGDYRFDKWIDKIEKEARNNWKMIKKLQKTNKSCF